jgi:hypothetical protein
MSAGGGSKKTFCHRGHREHRDKKEYDEVVKSQKHSLSLERERAGVRVEE